MEEKEVKRLKIAAIVNIIIFIMTVFAMVAMFFGIRFMPGEDKIILASKSAEMFKYFTIQSNLFMGIMALILAIDEIKVLKGKKKEISAKKYVLKLVSTTAVCLTFLVVFTYLGPFTKYGLPAMLMNSNLFFHFITPVISIFTFILFEKTDKIKYKYTFFGLIPIILYETFYITNILTHLENGKISPTYDWYLFAQNGLGVVIIGAPVVFACTYLISLCLWKFNKKKEVKEETK